MESYRALAALLVAALSLWPSRAIANTNGLVGVANTGCGTCHGSQNAATTVTITGPRSVAIGSTRDFRVVITNANPSLTRAGLNVASTAGELTATDPRTQIRLGEIAHRSPFAPMPAATWSVPFTWRAPTTPGEYQLQAAGNAVNNDGLRTAQDQWNLASFSVTVTNITPMDAGVAPDSGADTGVAPRIDGAARDSADATQDSLVDAGSTEDRPSPQSDASEATVDAPREDVSSATDARSASDGGERPATSAGCACSSARSRATGAAASTLSLLAAALGTARRRRASVRGGR